MPNDLSTPARSLGHARQDETFTLPRDGLGKWLNAWLGYFRWALKRRARIALAFLSDRGGFDGFRYLLGAPAAMAVLGASFGIVLLDEHLGFSRVILSSPPAQWVADLIEDTRTVVPGTAGSEAQEIWRDVETRGQDRAVAMNRPAKPFEAPAASLEPIEETVVPAVTDAISESDPRSEVAKDEGVETQIAAAALSLPQVPERTVFPRDNERPDTQTRLRPVAVKPPPAPRVEPPAAPPKLPIPPDVPSAPADPPVLAKVFEQAEPVLDEVASKLPKVSDVLQSTASTSEQSEKVLSKAIGTSAIGESKASEEKQAAVPAFIQLLQSGGRQEKAPELKAGEAKAIDRPLSALDKANLEKAAKAPDRPLASAKIELPKVPDRLGGNDRPLSLDLDGVVKPDRPQKMELPQLPEKPSAVERPIKIELPQIPEKPSAVERPIKIDRPPLPDKPLVVERPPKIDRPLKFERPDLPKIKL